MSDGNGNNGNGDNGSAYLPLYDNNGKERMVLEVGPSGAPSIKLCDKNGVDRLVIGLNEDGKPVIIFYNEKHEPLFLLHPNLFSFGEEGKGMFEIRQDDGGINAIMSSEGGKGTLVFGLSGHGGPLMFFADEARKPRIGMCLDEDGTPNLQMVGLDGGGNWQPDIDVPTK